VSFTGTVQSEPFFEGTATNSGSTTTSSVAIAAGSTGRRIINMPGSGTLWSTASTITPTVGAEIGEYGIGGDEYTFYGTTSEVNYIDSADAKTMTASLTPGTYIRWAAIVTAILPFPETIPVSVSDSGVGAETIGVQANIPCADTGIGSETVLPEYPLTITDQGLGSESELAEYYLGVQDVGLGAEFVWHLKNYCRVDSFDLPHVLSIRITDEAAISDEKIQDGTLPRRKMVGKPGRVVEINGWTKSQADIDAMEALVEGIAHVFLHPSGDSFAVRVKDFDPDRNVDRYNRRAYRMTLVELGTW
jgi:hypothetical protein